MDRTQAQNSGCTVSGAELLPPETGGADALCAAIAAARGPAGKASRVAVRVLSPHMIAAVQTLPDGTQLPEVKTARSDRPLGRNNFDMLATALADQLTAPRG